MSEILMRRKGINDGVAKAPIRSLMTILRTKRKR